MAQAKTVTSTLIDPSRRGFISQAAGVAAGSVILGPALPLPVSARASERVPDPILAAIEVHKAAVTATRRAVEIHSALERELPGNKRRSSVTAWEGEKVVATDDTRWIDAERQVSSCHDAETEAACAIINTPPETMAGVVALLQYAIAADIDGEGWPELQSDDFKRSRSWQFFLIEMLANTLPGIVQA